MCLVLNYSESIALSVSIFKMIYSSKYTILLMLIHITYMFLKYSVNVGEWVDRSVLPYGCVGGMICLDR